MTVLLGFAFISGVVTILSPCILPVLPIVLSGGFGRGKARPFGVLAGFVVSFTVFTLSLTAIVQAFGIPVDTLRYVAVGLMVLLGLVMIVPGLRDRFELLTSRIAGRVSKASGTPKKNDGEERIRAAGFWRGIPVGFSLGLVWTPCVGPIMASVITLALTQSVNGGAIYITLAYTIGTSIPMFAIMIGGRALLNKVPVLTRNSATIQKVFGVVMIVVGVAIGFGWDRKFQNAILTALPGYGSGLTAIEDTVEVRNALGEWESTPGTDTGSGAQQISVSDRPENGELADYGPAPALIADGPWFNTEGFSPAGSPRPEIGSAPLTMEDLRGKVVLLDFWTYSCINCIRTIPHLRSWYDTYKDQGFVIIGVHTPEFEFEKNPDNVRKAMADFRVNWPVVQDNNYAQWRSYSNRYWPAHYFIDATGTLRYYNFGEGNYDVSEMVIRELLQEAGATNLSRIGSVQSQKFTARTPETYLGYARQEGLIADRQIARDQTALYTPGGTPENGEWTLDGQWKISGEYIEPESAGTLEIGFNASNVFLVIEPQEAGATVAVFVDGRKAGNTDDVRDGVVHPDESRLYQLVGLRRAGEHLLRLEIAGKVRLFAFTFG